MREAASPEEFEIVMRIRCPNCHHGLEIVPDTPAEFITCPSCGSQLDPNSGETVTYKPETRQMIGRFELLEHVGRGHFGNVWRARDTQLKRIVAVKIPRTADLTESDRVLFLREAITAGHLRHANIVTVHEVGQDGDSIFIVSEFIEGVPLSEQLKIRQPTFAEAARWCQTVAEALDYAHEKGVIHRDIKPGNIMLEGDDKLFVLDFGLAKTEGGEFTITTEGEILGTPAYMSPEQARGEAASADRRSDVYSLGVVLYEMLTGEKPFQGGTRSLVHQILNEEPKSPRRLRPEIPRDLETICLRAMAKEPDRRYTTAKEMAEDLRRYLTGEPIRARPVRWPERSWRWVRRNPVLSGISGVSAVAVLLLMLQFSLSLFATPVLPSGPLPRNVQITILKRKGVPWNSGTEPTAVADVRFWRIDPRTGDFDLENPVIGNGASPIAAQLIPGDYLVVANIDDFGFHEVYRYVPDGTEGLLRAYKHQWSATLADGTIELPEIEVPPAAVSQGMARFGAINDFVMGSPNLSGCPPHSRRVAEFWLDAQETTIDEYEPVLGLSDPLEEPGNYPVHHVNWNMAVAYCEKIGKRLPEEAEFEVAATNRGRTIFPWGDNAGLIKEWNLGKVGEPGFDRTDTKLPVFGLYSNVGEWTASWAAPYPSDRKRGMVYETARFDRIVRGVPSQIIAEKEMGTTKQYNPRDRMAVRVETSNKRGIGFRGARSAIPRLSKDDFGAVK